MAQHCVSGGGMLRVFANRKAQAAAAANWLAHHIVQAAGLGKTARAALAGGTTPAPVYKLLGQKKLDWAQVEFLPTDERCLPPSHPRSNIGMLRQTLGAGKRLVALTEGAPAPPPDFILLGAGADGHVASLFADSSLSMRRSKVFRVCPAAQPEARLTLPMRALAGAPRLLLLICGGDKLRQLCASARNEATAAARLQQARSLSDLKSAGGEAFFGGGFPLAVLLATRERAGADFQVYYAD